MIKKAAPFITKSLTHILNLSIRNEQYPKAWKHASVIPIHKGGDRCNACNYRPISILPIISKILERWIHSNMYSYLNENNFIPNCQSGFRPLHSTESTLSDLINECFQAMNHGKITGTVFLDFSKAFDCVDHTILLEKLEKLNMSISVINWFKSYLSDRSQTVNIGKHMSKPLPLSVGVPQGSILGPLLFIIYTYDLPFYVSEKCKIYMYADDSTLILSSESIAEIETGLNMSLDMIHRWSVKNKIKVNASKTKCMLIGSKKKISAHELSVHINNNPVHNVKSFKCLGVTIDETLSWNQHVEYVKKTVSSKLAMLKRIRDCVTQKHMHTLILSLVMPSLDYCCTVWGDRYASHNTALNKCLKRAARIILKCDFQTPSADMFKKLDWLAYPERVKYKKAVLVFKSINSLAPQYMASLFTPHVQIRETRQSAEKTLKIPFARKESYASSFAVTGAEIWNNLSAHLRTMSSVSLFKSALRQSYVH